MTRLSVEEALKIASSSKNAKVVRLVRISCQECGVPLGAIIATGINLRQIMLENLAINLCPKCLGVLERNILADKDAIYADTRFDKQQEEMK